MKENGMNHEQVSTVTHWLARIVLAAVVLASGQWLLNLGGELSACSYQREHTLIEQQNEIKRLRVALCLRAPELWECR